MIYLLDLNYTLVANSDKKVHPFTEQIRQEQYRPELVARLAGSTVFLLTARPARHEAQTIESITAKTGWTPSRWFFNTHNLPPPSAKRKMMVDTILPENPGETFLAIESNPRTRAMFKSIGVDAMPFDKFLI